jgi:hypothetical protein
MKTLSLLLVGTVLVLFGCSKQDMAVVEPQQNQTKSDASARKIANVDLKIDRVIYSGSTVGDGAGGRIFQVTIMEKNIGTATSFASTTQYDEIKVYQRMRKSATSYYNRYLRSYRRTTDLAPNTVWTKPAGGSNDTSDYIWISNQYMPTDGSRAIELVFEADGGHSIAEGNEANNFSSPIRVTW